MNGKGKKLLNNTLLFLIGNIGSKLIQFFLVPLYTYTLTTEQYGITDVFFTTINFLIPIFSIQVSDGLLRFGLSKKHNLEDVISSSFRIMFFGTLLSIIFSPLVGYIPGLKNWVIFFVIILNLQIYRDLFLIVLKIKDLNKLFAINSIVYTFILCVLNILLLALFKMGINGYFLSYLLANLISIIILLLSTKIKLNLFVSKIDKKLMKTIALYTLPLIINSISYWITTASDRYMISIFLGLSSVGIYAIACKIPTIISTLSGIFNQAWMISSINEYENNQNSDFYCKTFDNYVGFTMMCCSVLIMISKFFMKIYVSPDYYIAWKYSPILIFSVIFSGICAFINGIFYAYKKNISITITTVIGALINIILNVFFIPTWGIMGASISTLISWGVIAICRIISIRKIVSFNIDFKRLILSALLITIETLSVIVLPNAISLPINIMLTVGIMFVEKKVIKQIFIIIKSYKKEFANKIRNRCRRKIDTLNKERLVNESFTIICSNCTGGVIYHNLDQQFRTPTINLFFEAKDFVKFCKNLDHYLRCNLENVQGDYNYPIARLDDILLYGVHYKDFEELNNKWNERKKRINKNNLFFMMTERDGCTYEDLIQFDNLKLPNKIVFTHKKYDDIKCSYYVKGTNNNDDYHKTKPLTDYKSRITSKRYIDDFDYVEWLNKNGEQK